MPECSHAREMKWLRPQAPNQRMFGELPRSSAIPTLAQVGVLNIFGFKQRCTQVLLVVAS